jgi:hypothetical protein
MTALGERGRAFVAQNPAWRSLARTPPAQDAPVWSPELTAEALGSVRVTRSFGRRQVRVEATAARDLRHAVARTELDAWRRHTGLGPGPFLDLLRADAPPWHDVVVAGLVDATVAQQDLEWAAALLGTGRLDTRAQLVLGLSIESRRSFGAPTDEETR